MNNLKDLLQKGRVVEFKKPSSSDPYMMGVVNNKEDGIVHQYGTLLMERLNDSLKLRYSDATVTKIYENTQDGLKLIWDRKNFIDWANTKIDTKVQVRMNGYNWHNRYFAKYEDGKVYTFTDGATSFSTDGSLIAWHDARLYNEEGKES